MVTAESGAKVIVVGLDGASPVLVRRWIDSGDLPNLAAVAERGCFGPLLSTPNAMSPAAWSSFVTGLEPGNHGVFYFMDRVPGTYQVRYVSSRARDGVPIWTALSAAGKRVASLFVPLTYPAVEVNGVLASGWLAPSLDDPAYACPSDLPARMLAAAPEFQLHTGMTEFVRRGRYAEALERKMTSLQAKAKVAADLLASEIWDLFTVVFDETDPVQHYFWHFHDPDHPEHGVEGTGAFGNAIFEMYRLADEAVGKLLSLAGDEAYAFIMSDHGQGPNTRGHLYLKGLLRAAGLQVDAKVGVGKRAEGVAHGLAGRLLPSGVKHRLAARFRGLHERLVHSSFAGDIDWGATRAYSFWSNGCAEPWINVRGRDPEGIVDPGDDYEATLREVVELVMQTTDPATGEAVAEGVVRRDEAYDGPHVDRAPDLLVEWRPDLVVGGLRCGRTGEVIGTPVAEDLRTGGHRREGLLLACGPRGATGQCPEPAGIADLAPTIYALLDVAPPHPLDGRPWLELFPDALHVREPETDSVAAAEGGEADAQLLEKRLEDLGYL